jgi:succinylarginine dihydrolase
MIMADTPSKIEFTRMATLKAGLTLEIAGLHRSRGPSCYTILKGLGYQGSREKVLEQITADVKGWLPK